MSKRKNLTKKKRFEIFKRDRFMCQYCGRIAPNVVLEVDHIIPICEGGENEVANLVTSCFDCNRGKGKLKLSDDAYIIKKSQIVAKESKKREQIEFLRIAMLEERSIDEEIESLIETALSEYLGCYVIDSYMKNLVSIGRKHGVEIIVESIKISTKYLDGPANSAIETALEKIDSIIKNLIFYKKNPNSKKTSYICGIIRNRFSFEYSYQECKMAIKTMLDDGVNINDIEAKSKEVETYLEFTNG